MSSSLLTRWIALASLAAAAGSPVFAAGTASGEAATEVLPARNLARLLLTNATRAGDRIVAVGDYGSIVYSDDNGLTWRRSTTPRRALLTAVRFADARHGWAVGHDGLILASGDAGASWHEQRYAPEEEKPLLDIWFKDAEHGIAIGAYGLYLETADGGKTWNTRAIIDEDKHLNAIASFDDHRLAIAAEAGGLLISDDDGQNWRATTSPYVGSFFGVLPLSSHGLLAFGLRGKTFRSEDAGAHWLPVEGAGEITLLGGAVLGERVVLVGSAGTVRVSRDGGHRFASQPAGLATAFAGVLGLDETHVLLFGEHGATPLELSAPAPTGAAP